MKLCYWLIDNGRTLSEHEEISRLVKEYPDVIRIIPNRNVGGAGGFTRGMIEAIEEKEHLGLTHVQMMDDDAVMDPELFVRAYGFWGCGRMSGRISRWAVASGGKISHISSRQPENGSGTLQSRTISHWQICGKLRPVQIRICVRQSMNTRHIPAGGAAA